LPEPASNNVVEGYPKGKWGSIAYYLVATYLDIPLDVAELGDIVGD